MDIKNAWENKTVRISVIGAALLILMIVITQSVFSTPAKKEKKTQKKDLQTGFLITQMKEFTGTERWREFMQPTGPLV